MIVGSWRPLSTWRQEKKTKIKCLRDTTYAIFLKSGEFKYIKYDILKCVVWHGQETIWNGHEMIMKWFEMVWNSQEFVMK